LAFAVNYYEHHLGDYIKDTVGLLTMTQEGAYRRLLDQYYARELPLPIDLKECHQLARATTTAERAAVDYVVGKFFKRTTDGYRQKRCDEEIERYIDGEPDRVAKRQSDKERQRRSRERRAKLFEDLRQHGITPRFDATIAHLEELLSRVTKPNGHGNGHGTRHNNVTPVTADNTATSPSPQSQSPFPKAEDPTPTPPKGGADRHRRSPARAEKDQALEVWKQLLASDGARPPRDSKLQAAIDAVGGWTRIQMREQGIDAQRVQKDFVEAYRSVS
jgi:uncharacterized protein YdaU (DUF1376 family)